MSPAAVGSPPGEKPEQRKKDSKILGPEACIDVPLESTTNDARSEFGQRNEQLFNALEVQPPPPPTCNSHSHTSVTLSYAPVSVTGVPAAAHSFWAHYNVQYSLEFQKVPKAGVESLQQCNRAAWQHMFLDESTVRIEDLDTGGCYAFRVRAEVLPLTGKEAQTIPPPTQPPCSSVIVCRTAPNLPGSPYPPALMSCTSNSLHLRWAAPDTGGDPILLYRLSFRSPADVPFMPPAMHWRTVYEGPALEVTVPNLLPAKKYDFCVQAANSVGFGPWSKPNQHTTFASPPSQCKQLQVIATTRTSVSLCWAAPLPCGASVLRYFVEVAAVPGAVWHLGQETTETRATITDLQPGQAYTFRVRAENERGLGPWPEHYIITHTTAIVPVAPLKCWAHSVTATTVWFSWRTPERSDPKAQFEVEARAVTTSARQALLDAYPAPARRTLDVCKTAWVSVYKGKRKECHVGPLQSGCQYLLRVRTCSDCGRGIWTAPVRVVTHDVLQPSGLTIVRTSPTGADLAWQSPSKPAQGVRILGFQVECAPLPTSENARKAINCIPDDAWTQHIMDAQITKCKTVNYTLRGIAPCTSFAARVRTCTSSGMSTWTATVRGITTPGVPATPCKPTVTCISSTTLSVAWEAPCSHGAPIQGYIVQYLQRCVPAEDSCSGGCHGEAMEEGWESPAPHQQASELFVVSDSCGVSPQCIADMSSEGEGSGTPGHSLTPGSLLDSCDSAGLSTMPLFDDSDMHWSFVEVSATSTSTHINDLCPSSVYSVRIAVVNAVGTSGFSLPSQATTAAAPPPAARRPSISSFSSTSLSLAWHWPVAPRSVQVQCACLGMHPMSHRAPNAESDWNVVFSGRQSECTVGNLQPGQSYAVRLRAFNGTVYGEWSPKPHVVVDLPHKEPSAPGPAVCTFRGPRAVRLKWPGASVPEAVFCIEMASDGGSFQHLMRTSSTEKRIDQLCPSTSYSFRICTESPAGVSTFSPTTLVTTLPPPPPPPSKLHCFCALADGSTPRRSKAATTTISVSWAHPGPHAAGFEVEAMKKRGATTPSSAGKLTATSKGHSAAIRGAALGSVYTIRVRVAGHARGQCSPWSESYLLSTPPARSAPLGGKPPAVPHRTDLHAALQQVAQNNRANTSQSPPVSCRASSCSATASNTSSIAGSPTYGSERSAAVAIFAEDKSHRVGVSRRSDGSLSKRHVASMQLSEQLPLSVDTRGSCMQSLASSPAQSPRSLSSIRAHKNIVAAARAPPRKKRGMQGWLVIVQYFAAAAVILAIVALACVDVAERVTSVPASVGP